MMTDKDDYVPGLQEKAGRVCDGYADDGCDWTSWLVWAMRERCRLRTRQYLPAPRRPQVTTGEGRRPHGRRKKGVVPGVQR